MSTASSGWQKNWPDKRRAPPCGSAHSPSPLAGEGGSRRRRETEEGAVQRVQMPAIRLAEAPPHPARSAPPSPARGEGETGGHFWRLVLGRPLGVQNLGVARRPNRDGAGLHGFRNLALERNVEEAVVHIGTLHLDMVGE